jgi:hypothetical protein
MRTNMASTSLDTYRSFGVASYLQPKEQAVMAVFQPGTILTREQIAQRLGWKESAVCGRVNSLVTKGCLIEAGTAKTSTGHTAKLVKLPVVQMELI